jgi:hypothetical protein
MLGGPEHMRCRSRYRGLWFRRWFSCPRVSFLYGTLNTCTYMSSNRHKHRWHPGPSQVLGPVVSVNVSAMARPDVAIVNESRSQAAPVTYITR